jgi:UDP-N-acetyl-2-amino-2-deoxyglucuronate dehydrogenase
MVGFAVLGYGRIGQRHARLIRETPGASLVAVADPRVDLMTDIGVPRFPSLNDLLASDLGADIGVVSIATPNGLHVTQAMDCLKAGKHVMVEKPVALHKKELYELLALAGERKLHVFPVLQNRLVPGARWLKALVDSGSLGKHILVQINCFWNRDNRYYKADSWHGNPALDGGVLFTQFSHFVDLLIWLFGEVKEVQALMCQSRQWINEPFPDTGTLQFRLPHSGIGALQFSTGVWDKNMDSSISILAENGSVKVSGQYLDRLDYCHVKTPPPPFDPGDWPPEQGHRLLIGNVVEVLQDMAEPAVTGADTIGVIELIESIYKQILS